MTVQFMLTYKNNDFLLGSFVIGRLFIKCRHFGVHSITILN